MQVHPFSQFRYCPKCGSSKFEINNFKSKKCEDCKFSYYFNSSASTVALIINSKNELLVATRAHEPAKGTYDLPGGFVDSDETGEEAIQREVMEETGLEIEELKYLYSTPNRYIYSEFEVHTLDMIYLCKVDENQTPKADDDVAKLQFIPISELKPELFGLLSIKTVIKNINKIKI